MVAYQFIADLSPIRRHLVDGLVAGLIDDFRITEGHAQAFMAHQLTGRVDVNSGTLQASAKGVAGGVIGEI